MPARFFSAQDAFQRTARPRRHRPAAPACGALVPATTPFDRLRRFVDRHRRHGFIDLRPPRPSRLRFIVLKLRLLRSKGAPVLGYIADGEYWIPGDQFEVVAGGSREALALKKELFRRRLIVTDRRGTGVSYVVKRPLPDGTRPFFVVVRHRPKKPPGGVRRSQRLRAASVATQPRPEKPPWSRGPSASPRFPRALVVPTDRVPDRLLHRRIHCRLRSD